MALSDATRLADFGSTVPSFGDINAIGVVTATGGMDGIGIHSGGNVIHSGIITALNFIGTGNTFAINGTTVDISISGAAGTDNINTGTAATFSSSVAIADSIFHIGDTDTSIRFPANDTFTIETTGTEALRVQSDGDVGIGTIDNSNNERLRVQDDATTSTVCQLSIISGNAERAVLNFGDKEDPNIGRVNYDHRDNHLSLFTNNSERLRIVSAGNIGIGVTNPEDYHNSANQLVVKGATNGGITIRSNGTSDSGNLWFADGDSGDARFRGMVRYEHDSDAMVFKTAGDSERVRIDSSGNVGIGTETPTDAAHANNSAKLNVGIITARQYFGDGSNLTGTGHVVGSGQTTITSTSTFNNSGSFARFAEMDASYTTVGTGSILVTCSWSLTQDTTSSDLSWKLFRKINSGAASEILVNPSLQGSSSSGMIPNFRETVNQQGARICYSFIDSPGHSAGDLITYEHHINCEGSNVLRLNFGAQTASRHCTTVSTITFLELSS